MEVEMSLFLIRGLPGSGKTTEAKRLLREGRVQHAVAADDWFERDGRYRFNPRELSSAHRDCLQRATEALERGESVAVHNTFSRRWEAQPYIDLAARTEAALFVVDLFDAGLVDADLAARNVHGVPATVIRRMRERWEPIG